MKETRRTRRAAVWDCGVPMTDCTGGAKTHGEKFRAHGTRGEAVACGHRYAKQVNDSKGATDPILLPPTPQRLKPGKVGRIMPPRIRG